MTDEEKRLIVNTPIDESCFEKWEDYHYEEIRVENFEYPTEKGRKCTVYLYPTTLNESIIRNCEVIRLKYIKTKNEHYFDMLVHLLPKSYKGGLKNGITYRKTLQTYHNAKKMNRLSFTLKNGMRIFKNSEIIIAWDSTKKHF